MFTMRFAAQDTVQDAANAAAAADDLIMEFEPPVPQTPRLPLRRGRLFVVSGPSGVGKDTVLSRFHEVLPGTKQCVTMTTRKPRPGETQGNPYFFVSVSEFDQMTRTGAFFEFAEVNGNLYGTPRQWVEEQRAGGFDVILKIDVQGGLTARLRSRDAILIFLLPPSMEELERRLRSRSTETEDQITRRLIDARSELQQMSHYDFVVENRDIDAAADQIRAIVLAERCRIVRDTRSDGSDSDAGSSSGGWSSRA